MPMAPSPGRTLPPFVFQAKVLLNDGEKQRERDCQVVLADGKVVVQAANNRVLEEVPYERVVSISYSKGRDPLWTAPSGPAPVARTGGGLLGAFKSVRHWVSLRTANADSQFVVLRLGNDSDQRRAVVALEERTGRTGEFVTERKGDK